MTEGSRWYFPTYEGLFDEKHVANMGSAIWLYGWMLARAHVAQNRGHFQYTHLDACEALGVPERTLKRWFKTLQEYGYVLIWARERYCLDVAITNWRPVEEWLSDRRREGVRGAIGGLSQELRGAKNGTSQDEDATRGAKNGTSQGEDATRGATRDAKNGTPTISIRLLGYEYPENHRNDSQGAETAPADPLWSLAGAYQSLTDLLRTTENRPAVLREVYRLCFGGREEDLPDYGHLGKLAKQVGGAGYLAQIMWQLSAKRPEGDVLNYIYKAFVAKKGQGSRRNGSGADHRDEILRAYMAEGQNGQ